MKSIGIFTPVDRLSFLNEMAENTNEMIENIHEMIERIVLINHNDNSLFVFRELYRHWLDFCLIASIHAESSQSPESYCDEYEIIFFLL
jgi:hypothetical protein